ncbi:amino acid adenylation domain-containing protein, partial [Lysobacter sp. ISL-42]|uniref:non-ribosomal peptide synthetase n=2 Tax=Lysobacter TaxID=68 RepID=UPI001BEAB69D
MSKSSESLEELKRSILLNRLKQRAAAGAAERGARDAIGHADRSQSLPLSWAQQRLWFLDQLDHSAGAAYHMPVALQLSGELDLSALRNSLDRIVARHENLRTRFVSQSGAPVQVIDPADTGFALNQSDLRGLSADEQAAAVRTQSREEARAPFDMAQGPLIRGRLLRLSEHEHVLLVTQHHIVSDGWSIGVLVQEVTALYDAFRQGKPDPLPPLPIQYADYAAWQRGWLQGETLQRQSNYWRERLRGAPAVLELPADRPRPPVQSYAGDRVPVRLSSALSAQLRSLSQRHGTTIFMTLLAGWSILLSRLSGQSEVVVGSPVANRQRRELEPLIGFFVNTLALRVDLQDAPSVADLLSRVKSTTLAAYEHQDLPFEQVVEAVQPARSMSHSPLFQAMLTMNNTPGGGGGLSLAGLRIAALESPHPTTHFDLALSLNEGSDGIAGNLEFSTDLLDRDTVERYVGHFATLLAAMCSDDQSSIARLPLLTRVEHEAIVEGFNGDRAETGSGRLLHELIQARVHANPNAIALEFEGQALSYGELNRRANRLAHRLIASGVKPDDRVAICAERGLDIVVGLLGILKAGGGYVPLDPAYPPERLAHMLADSAPVALVTQRALRDSLPLLRDCAVPMLDLDGQDADSSNADNPDPSALSLQSRHLAYVIYTSGSTGEPKGVMIEHASIVAQALTHIRAYALTPKDRTLEFATFSFDSSVIELFPALCAGATVVLRSADMVAPDKEFEDFLRDRRLSVIDLPTAFWHQWVQEIGVGRSLPGADLRLVAVAGEKVERRYLSVWLAAPSTRGCRWLNLYGPTEATVDSTFIAFDGGASVPAGEVPIGRPMTNTRVYLLDENRQPVPIGVAGEIHVGGAGVARGYWNRPELTAERFVRDPFNADPQARMYKTGDLGRWLADGTIEYLGRNDAQVKIRGFRIELGEIETQLAACEGVREAVVIAREDSPGDKRLVAYLLAHEGVVLSGAALRERLSHRLAEYMVPSAFVMLESLPLTPNGKLDRKALPAPDQSAVLSREYEAPQGEIESAIAAVWQELLGLEQVGRHDHFFELGGHSLLAVQVASRLRQSLGLEIPLRDLFARPTPAALAAGLQGGSGASQSPIGLADRGAALPLSWAQQRLWFLDQLDHSAGAAYHMPVALRLSGELDRSALRGSLDRIVARHENLRTRFVTEAGAAVQVIDSADVGFALSECDLSDMSADEQAASVAAQSREEARAAFDLAQGPLIRGRLLRLSESEHVLLVTQHHIVSDGWSIGVLVQEVSALYDAFRQGQPDPLPPLPIQYADYAAWQRGWLQGETLQRQSNYWREQLRGAPAVLELPTDRPRPPVQSYAGDRVPVRLSGDLSAQLRSLSQRHGTTVFMTLLAGWSILLSRLSGQSEVVVGSPVANRQRSELEPLIGFFVNTLALRVDLQEVLSVAELLSRVKATTLAAYEHQDLPFEQVVEAVQPARSMSHSPLFQAMLTMNNTPGGGGLNLPGLSIESLDSGQATTHFDLELSLSDNGESIVGGLLYSTDLFDRETAERYVASLTVLLQHLAQESSTVDALPWLPAGERERVVEGFNATAAPRRIELIHRAFEVQARATPEAIALEFDGARLTYGELNRRANRLAHRLIGVGVKPDERVAICVERSLEMVVGLLGTLKAGGAYVPLDPSYPRDRLAYMLEDCAPTAVLVHAATRELLPEGAVPPRIALDADPSLVEQNEHDPEPESLGLTPRHLAYVIYTSGSTGQPKGVMNEHHAVMNRLDWGVRQFPWSASDRVLQKTPFGFDVSVWEFFQPLLSGATLVLAKPLGHQDPDYLVDLIESADITVAHFVPSMLQVFVDRADAGRCKGLKQLFCSGEALPYSLQQQVFAALPGVELHNLYGPTEAAIEVTYWNCAEPSQRRAVPIGRPVANTQMYVLDARGEPVPVGVAGELFIAGVQVARGYWNRPELTAERFVRDPFSADPKARMYKTGDLGRWLADGTIEYLGRNDFQVKIRGFRIELGEIEARLVACDGVREAVVIAREDIEGDKRLVAYAVMEPGVELSVATLREVLSKDLAEYMVPSAFVALEALPLTPNGKLDRKALPAPDQAAVLSREYAAPQGEIETAIADIWQDLLGIERVGRHDHFFELGGHSLLAVQVASRLRQSLGLEIPLRDLFSRPTPAALAASVQDAQSESQPPITLVDRNTALPLSWAQQRLWFLDQLDHSAGAAYHMPVALQLRGELDRAALQNSLNRIVARHENLRTRFVSQSAAPVQVIDPMDTGFVLIDHDLSDLTADAQTSAVATQSREEARAPFDLAQGPLIRGRLLRLSEHEHVLLVTQHHIVSDGWSIGVLVKEVSALYDAYRQGQPDPLPPLPIQYADYAAWQRGWLQGETLQRQATYWREQLSGAPAVLELPTDRPRPALQSYAGDRVPVRLSSEVSAQLRALSQRHGTTVFMTLLAGWSVLLSRLSGQSDVVVGSPVANRQRSELEPLIGFFVNTLALRVDLQHQPSVADLLAQVKATTLAAYEHQDLPFEQVVEAVQPARSMSHSPLFQALLSLNNTPDGGGLQLHGLTLSQLDSGQQTAQFDLALSLTDNGNALSGSIAYASDLFDRGTVERMMDHWATLLTAMVADDSASVARLPLLTPPQRAQVLQGFHAQAHGDAPRQVC